MFKVAALSGLRRFSEQFDYDVDYLRYTLNASQSGFYKFGLLKLISGHQGPIPDAPWFCGAIRATLAEDCGPCVQLGCSVALKAGIAPDLVRQVLAQEYDSVPDDVSLVCRYADLVVVKSLEADDLKEEILAKWGDAGLVSIAMGISAVRLYPLYKQALGYGKSCQMIAVGPSTVLPSGINMETR